MAKQVSTILIAVLFAGTLFAGDALGGKGRSKASKGKVSTVQTTKGQNNGVCPFGHTPGTGKATVSGQLNRFGSCDGNGTSRNHPQDGTGNGAIKQGKGSTNNTNCDDEGPKGRTKSNGQDN